MAQIQDLLVGIDENTATATGTTAATATQTAPGTDQQLIITGFSASVVGPASAGGTVQIRQNGGGIVRKNFQLPNGEMAPIIYEFKRPLKVPANQDADVILTGRTGATAVRVELYTITRPVTV